MAALGFSINTLTLFGLILAIAIVVDDAIVVTENATRILDEGSWTPVPLPSRLWGDYRTYCRSGAGTACRIYSYYAD